MFKFKKLLNILLLSLSVLAIATGGVYARETRSSQVVVLDPPAGETKNFYILTGENVEIRGIVNGDVYAIGGVVDLTGKINGDLIAIGGDVNIDGEVSDDARIIAQNVKVTGKVGKNLTTLAEKTGVEGQGLISGGIATFSKELNISGRTLGQINAGAKVIYLENLVGGPVELWVDTLNIGNSASIKENLNYHSDKDANVSASATVSGQVTRTALPQFEKRESMSEKTNLPFKVISFLGALLLGMVTIKLFPKFISQVLEIYNKDTLKSGLIGFALLILLPIISILTFITIIGIPLSIFNILFYFIFLYVAKIFAALFIGKKLLPTKSENWRLVLGLFIIYVVSVVPVVGSLLASIAKIIGFGATYLTLKDNFWKPSRK